MPEVCGEGRPAMKRSAMPARTKPLRPVSDKRLAMADGAVFSTFSCIGLSRAPFRQPAGQAGTESPVVSRRVTAERAPSLRGGGRLRGAGHRVERDSATVVRERSGGRCEIGMDGCWGTARELHHRVTRKSGGRHGAASRRSDRASNLMHGCGRCHLIVTDHPRRAYRNGWSLREWQEPSQEPVLYRGGLVYLDEFGGVHSFEVAGA
jgi:hypothetical protein